MNKRRWPLLILSVLIPHCAASGKVIRVSGDASLKAMDRQVIGVSRMLADEQDAMKDGFAHALSQIASFNGISIAEEYSQEIIEVHGKTGREAKTGNLDSLNIQRRTFAKSFFRLFRVQYYVECYREHGLLSYKAWCYIPFNEQIKHNFLQSLIDGYQSEIETVESKLPALLEDNPTRYPDSIKEVMDFYTNVLQQSEGYFMETNEYIIFLKQKIQTLKADMNQFFDNLTCRSHNDGVNQIAIEFQYREQLIRMNFKINDLSTPAFIDTFAISWDSLIGKILLKPARSGKTIMRIHPAGDNFHAFGIDKFFDLPVDLQLINRFVGKKVALAIYNSRDKQTLPDATSLLGRLLADLESSALIILPGTEAAMINDAKMNNCQMLICGEVEILDIRHNVQQEIYIAFPSCYLKVIDLNEDKLIYQNSFPNSIITANEMREFGTDIAQALKNGLSLRNLIQSKLFFNELINL